MATELIYTLKPVGGDYTSISAWEAAMQGTDWVTADQIPVLECYKGDYTLASGGVNYSDTYVEFRGWTGLDATHYAVVRAAAGEEHGGDISNALKIKTATDSKSLYIRQSNLKFIGIGLENTYTSSANPVCLIGNFDVLQNVEFISVVVNGAGVGAHYNQAGLVLASNTHTNINFKTCLVSNIGGHGLSISDDAGSVLNCTVVDCNASNNAYRYGIELSTNAVAKNCISYGSGSKDFNGGVLTTCASSDTTGSTGLQNIASSEFFDYAGGDYHLASTSSLIGAGTNLSSSFTTDIDGDAWPSTGAWDIGFDYYVASGGGTTYEVSTSYSLTQSATQATNAIFGASMTLANSLSESDGTNADYQSNASMSHILSDTATVNAIFAAATSYAQALSDAYTSTQTGVISASLSLGALLGQSDDVTAQYIASTLFNESLSLSVTGGLLISDAVTMAITQSVSESAIISIEGSLLIGITEAVSQSNTAVLNANLLLNNQLILTAINQGIINAGLDLSALQSVTQTGSSFTAGIVTPSGRTITVSADTRTMTTEAGIRVVTVSSETRKIIV